MIVYFDASALVPLYVRDRVTTQATRARRAAKHIATSLLSYAEVLAALGHLRDRKALDDSAHRLATSRFLGDWPTMHRVPLQTRLLGDVRRILEAHRLKGADAVQLASALLVLRAVALEGLDGRFACDDRALSRAARGEGLFLAW
jgi:predicted nucleic acid-binding protein